MIREENRLLKVFLCHASGDKPPVRDLYKRLTAEGVDAWLDQEKLLPGQDWRLKIPQAVQEADVVIICLSKKSITKEGYVQKEIKFALDIAEEKPEGTIFLIPARLEGCIVPERLNRWQWVDLYEEDGFIKLLRSLKLRADAVGATVEPNSYGDSGKEAVDRLAHLYTEGLAAFYTEDWDRACQRFRSILSERPNHKNATEKLAEAERQRSLSKLYSQASEATQSEDWGIAVQTLEELSQKSGDYKDAAQLLKNARKQKQLKELYAEAEALHSAQKWKAVIKVFEQMAVIEPDYPDTSGLLPSAQKEVAELQRLDELNDQYSRALGEMESGNWHEARRLLELVHKSQTGFLDTEKLLRKVENEISREDEKRRQNDQINTLYEQAHGLLRSKKWRNALDKLEQIRKLDDHFPDTDKIAERAQKELAREEQEAERQNKLAALYAEAVRLLKEEKYKDALDKWQEVRAVDSKYPDRQWVQRTAKKKLTEVAKPREIPRKLVIRATGIAVIMVLLVGVIIGLLNYFTDPVMYDDFDNVKYNGSFNPDKWILGASPGGEIFQQDGILVLTRSAINTEQKLSVREFNFSPTKVTIIRANLMLDMDESGGSVAMHIATTKRLFMCGLSYSTWQCNYEWLPNYDFNTAIISGGYSKGEWLTFITEINPVDNSALFGIKGGEFGSIDLDADELLTQVGFTVWNNTDNSITGYVDNVVIESQDAP